VTGRAKEILFVNGQNYYPHDLEQIAQELPGLEAGRLVIASARPPGSDSERILAFVLHRGELEGFVTVARMLARTLAEHTGIELDAVVPVPRIPKTTSGKIQRHLLVADYLSGAFDPDLAVLDRLRSSGGNQTAAIGVQQELLSMCEAELDGRHLDPDQSLFELGASSLKLITIHDRIEQRWAGIVEITDIFEHPSIRALGAFIESRLGPSPPRN
jgi:acyl carrier protein